ncbi:uncharacterized protein L3040_003465 [Drepanopeziza brunnea f. sp. 'multigermtubi']|uniref:uncharacterized protein n=1 Tax=Drepanopeziza brunnea f. sp. 'multigermtubi' TaxID=698441 RepID=UPI002382AB50|nr:hypothetical protein L3040_003465 [Drepanopeziza brunnea f. sp. 'multigermtubi']
MPTGTDQAQLFGSPALRLCGSPGLRVSESAALRLCGSYKATSYQYLRHPVFKASIPMTKSETDDATKSRIKLFAMDG